MKTRSLVCAALLVCTASVAQAHHTEAAAAAAHKAKPAAAKPAMDPKAMEEMMEKMAAPGPHHERFKKMEGTWDAVVKMTMDPSQPMTETKSTSTMRTLMDGRYLQEDATSTMMGKPFSGMALMGYDNVAKKYVGSWIDNMGTGIMTSEGTPDASGMTINWTGVSSDPTTGKPAHFRMVSHWTDDDHWTYSMFSKGPAGKEMKVMEIAYTRHM